MGVELACEIKNMNIEKKLTDHIAFLVFNGLFTTNIGKEIKAKASLLRYLFEKFGIPKAEHQILFNLAYNLAKAPDLGKYMSTILKLLFDAELLHEKESLEWLS